MGSMFCKIVMYQTGRQLFATRARDLGFGPCGIDKADVVCIFNGAKTPHVLRRLDPGDKYRLVGEAYLHGYMYGEVEDLGVHEESITLI